MSHHAGAVLQAESSAATAAAKQDGKSGGSRTTGGLHDLAHLRLSNKLNPNNIYFDPVLAERYKRMTKAEKDTMWVQDSQSRTSAGLGTSNAEVRQSLPPSETVNAAAPVWWMPSHDSSPSLIRIAGTVVLNAASSIAL